MLFTWWRNLSVAKKLYAVVGVMALLIAMELFTLLFAMDTLSAVRSFVGGEGLWSKAQKNAVHSLHRYVYTSDKRFYQEFHQYLQIPLGDRIALLEFPKDHPDFQQIRQGFLRGNIHPNDIPGLIKLIQRFRGIRYVSEALDTWKEADGLITELLAGGEELHAMLSRKHRDYEKIQASLNKIDRLNDRLTVLENNFSRILGEGSRWMEQLLMIILIITVLTVETTGLLLTVRFTRNLSRSLEEITKTAQEVGKGNFDRVTPVRSRDELGRLAEVLNKMGADLKEVMGLKRQAESANQVKTLFLANMSHEIRTPLGVMLGLTEVLKDQNISWEDHTKYVQTLERTGQNLMRIINDILDVSRVESGHLQIEKSVFSLPEFMGELKSMLEIQAEKNDNLLVFESLNKDALEVFTDRTRLRQIVLNLVSNALKFTKHGRVTVFYGRENSHLIFRVSDTGTGISQESIAKLFKPFSQGDDSATRPAEGTGLGLVLSKRLAQAMGGDVILEKTEIGKGTTFLVKLPYEKKLIPTPVREIKPTQTDDLGLQGARILVVEDSPDNQLLVRLFLGKHGVQLSFADNGQQGYEAASHGDFDMVLMDIQMPVMDGYTATRKLREQGFVKPIIALTAHAMKEDRDLCLQAGCNDYLTKPIDPKILTTTIAKYLHSDVSA